MVKGGKRLGAGRPKGQGKFGETTKAVRIPISKLDDVFEYINNNCYKLPLYLSNVSAGFPSPAEDYVDKKLDLNEYLIKNPSSTFFLKVSGDSMINAGINDGDILLVDKSLNASHGSVVIAIVDDLLTVKRLYKKNGQIKLMPENDKYSPIEINENSVLSLWGVVTNVIHKV